MRVTVDMSGVPRRVSAITRDASLGQFAASEAMRLMNPYVPMRSGQLAGSAVASPFEVTYSTPYARRVYYGDGTSFRRDRHANARSRWDRGIDVSALAKSIQGVIDA